MCLHTDQLPNFQCGRSSYGQLDRWKISVLVPVGMLRSVAMGISLCQSWLSCVLRNSAALDAGEAITRDKVGVRSPALCLSFQINAIEMDLEWRPSLPNVTYPPYLWAWWHAMRVRGWLGGMVLERTRKDQWTFMPWFRLKEVSVRKTTLKNQEEIALLLRLKVRR